MLHISYLSTSEKFSSNPTQDLNSTAYNASADAYSSNPFMLQLVGRWRTIEIDVKNFRANITGANVRGEAS